MNETHAPGSPALLAGFISLLAFACAAPRPAEKQAPPRASVALAPSLAADEGASVEYRPSAEGKTLVEVASPEGALVQIYDAAQVLISDAVPLSVPAAADHYYRIVAHLPSGALREKKVQATAGQVAVVRFVDSGPRGPQPMGASEFKSLEHAIDLEGSDTGKLSVLRTAAANAWFTTRQAGLLIERVVYRQDKLEAVPLLKDRILDKENRYQLYQHFTYREDKEKVRLLLEK